MNKNVLLFLLLVLFSMNSQAFAQFTSKEEFYRPVSAGDLNTRVAPRIDQDRLLSGGNETDFFSFSGSGGCPDTVLIGSVDGDSDVFGGVDIDVVVESDIIINCGRL